MPSIMVLGRCAYVIQLTTSTFEVLGFPHVERVADGALHWKLAGRKGDVMGIRIWMRFNSEI